MTYSLYRTQDNAGDSGGMCITLKHNPDYNPNADIDDMQPRYLYGPNRPTVGYAIRVGSLAGRTYSPQDWWQTTYVTEILEEREDYVRFKTGNSEYVWRIIGFREQLLGPDPE